MVERADRAPVATFFVPAAWGAVVALDDAAAHHVQVKRLRDGDPVRLTSGDGRLARGVLADVGKRRASVMLDDASVEIVPAPPEIAMLAPVGDRDRMLTLAEKAVELGLSRWHPVLFARSRSVSPRGEGDAFREKVRLRMISALEQSGGAWLPTILREEAVTDALSSAGGDSCILLDAAGAPVRSIVPSLRAPCIIAIGPEGGVEAAERSAFMDAGWRPASIGANVLRFETAGIAALAIVRAHLR